MKRCFAALMKLYPPGYRALFADEMASVFEDARRDRRSQGRLPHPFFVVTEFAGLVRGAVLARSLGILRNPPLRIIIPLLGGVVTALTFAQSYLHSRRFQTVARPHLYSQDEILKILLLAAVSIVFIAACSAAFVLNLRSIARRLEHPSKT